MQNMITLQNTLSSAVEIVKQIKAAQIVPIFDMDGVFIDASHRQICNPDGSLNLDKYREMSTPDRIAQDKELPLIAAIHMLQDLGIDFHICTARVFCEGTAAWLAAKNVRPVSVMSRDGHTDTRRDFELKSHKISAAGFKNAVLIDDNLNNCKAALALGLYAVHVPFAGH
jgi:hypothetical protein